MALRPLTAGERKLAEKIFGTSIAYDDVQISDKPGLPFQPMHVTMVVGNVMYTNGTYLDDYTRGSHLDRAHFVHEMTHVWQVQNNLFNQIVAVTELQLKHKFNYAAAYYYTLDAANDLTTYGLEQQASIIEEYYLIKHEGMASYSRHCENRGTPSQKIALFEQVLKNFLNNPSYARRDTLPPVFGKKGPKS